MGNGACSTRAQAATAACIGTAGYFQNNDISTTHTFGLSSDWKVTEKLRLRGEYTVSYGTVMFGEFNGAVRGQPDCVLSERKQLSGHQLAAEQRQADLDLSIRVEL